MINGLASMILKPLIVLLLSSACALSSEDCKCSKKRYEIWNTIDPHWHQFRDAFSVHVEELLIEMVQKIVSDKIQVERLGDIPDKTIKKKVKNMRVVIVEELAKVEEIMKSFSQHDMKAFGDTEREGFNKYTNETNSLIDKWHKSLKGSISDIAEKFCDFVLLAYAVFGNIFIGVLSIIRDKFFGLAIDLSNFMNPDKPGSTPTVGDWMRSMGLTEDHFGFFLNNVFTEGDDIFDSLPKVAWVQMKYWVNLDSGYVSAFADKAGWLTTNSFTPNQAILYLAQKAGAEAFVGQLLWWMNPASWLGLLIRTTLQAVNIVLKTMRCEDYFKIIYDRLLGFLFTQIGVGAELQTFRGELEKCPWLPAFTQKQQQTITTNYLGSVFGNQGVWFGTVKKTTEATWLEKTKKDLSSWKALTTAITVAGTAERACADEKKGAAEKSPSEKEAADNHCYAVEKEAAEKSLNASWVTPQTQASGSGCPQEEELATTKKSIDEFFQCQVIQYKFDKKTKSEAAHNDMKTTLKTACERTSASATICMMINQGPEEAAKTFIDSVRGKNEKPETVLTNIGTLEHEMATLQGYDIWKTTQGFFEALQARKKDVYDFKITWAHKLDELGPNSEDATSAAQKISEQLKQDVKNAADAITAAAKEELIKNGETEGITANGKREMYKGAAEKLKTAEAAIINIMHVEVKGLKKAFDGGVANFKKPLWSLVSAFNKVIKHLETTENRMFTAIIGNAKTSKKRLRNIADAQKHWMGENKQILDALEGHSFDVFDFITYGPAGIQIQEDAPAGKKSGGWFSWIPSLKVRAKRPARHAVRKLLRTIVRAGAGRGQQADKKTAVAARVRSNKPLKKIMNKLLRNLLHRGTAKS